MSASHLLGALRARAELALLAAVGMREALAGDISFELLDTHAPNVGRYLLGQVFVPIGILCKAATLARVYGIIVGVRPVAKLCRLVILEGLRVGIK